MQNQFSQVWRSPYHRTNSSVHATKAVEVLNTSTSSVYSLDTQGWFHPWSSRWASSHLLWADWLQLMGSGFEPKFSFPMEGVRGSLGAVEAGGVKCCWGGKSSGYENPCNAPQKQMMVLVSAQEDRRDLLPQAPITAICTSCSGQTSQEKQQDLDFGFGESSVGYSWHRQGLATLLSVLLVQGFPTSPMCCSAWCLQKNTHLVTCTYSHHLMCWSLRSLFKHSRTNVLG